MDVSDFIKREFLVWNDVRDWGSVERTAVIISRPELVTAVYNGKETKKLLITLQLSKDKSIRKYRANPGVTADLAKMFGTNTADWLGAVVRFDPYVYAADKTTIELKPVRFASAVGVE